MKHMYSNQLVSYLFNELDVENQNKLEKELATNEALRKELATLKSSLSILKNDKPIGPNKRIIDTILEESKLNPAIPVD